MTSVAATSLAAFLYLFLPVRRRRAPNPAQDVDCGPPPVIRKRPGYSWRQAAQVLGRLATPAREMAELSMATGMNIAEICGLRLRSCNFIGEIMAVEGEVLAPYTVGVRENFYRNRRGTLKAGKRCRNLPIPRELAEALAPMVAKRQKFQSLDDPLFASRVGTPPDAHNIASRVFRPLG